MFVRFNYGNTLHYVAMVNATKTSCGQQLKRPNRDLAWSTNLDAGKMLRGNYFTGCMLCDHCAKRLPIDVRGMIK